VYVNFAPLGAPIHDWRSWYSLRLVLYYLSDKKFFLESISSNLEMNQQLERLARFVSEHFQEILTLFSSSRIDMLQAKKESLYRETLEIEASIIKNRKR
jgi:hypothetical protein